MNLHDIPAKKELPLFDLFPLFRDAQWLFGVDVNRSTASPASSTLREYDARISADVMSRIYDLTYRMHGMNIRPDNLAYYVTRGEYYALRASLSSYDGPVRLDPLSGTMSVMGITVLPRD